MSNKSSFTAAAVGLIEALAITVFAVTYPGVGTARERTAADPGMHWRVRWANDALLDSDNQFTNGFQIEKHSAAAATLENTSGTPALGKFLANWLLPEDRDLRYRESWVIAQNMQTPDDKASAELLKDDVPYMGMLGISNDYIAWNDLEMTGFALTFGWVGPVSQAERTQKLIHELSRDSQPNGWQNQLSNEPILNLQLTRKRKIASTDRFDVAWSLDAALGNLTTFGQAGLELRFGELPGGFAPSTGPLGRSISGDTRLPLPGERHVYGSLALSATHYLHAIARDGNFFSDGDPWTQSNGIEPRDTVSQAIVGLHFEKESWTIDLSYWLTTDTFDSGAETQIRNRDDSFGVVAFSWRMN